MATKPEIIARLTELGIAHDPSANKPELEALLPVEEGDNKEEKVGKNSATVSWKGKTRTYSKELHGADFKELAKEFAAKVNGKVV